MKNPKIIEKILVIQPPLQPANLTALLLYWGGQAQCRRNAYGRRLRSKTPLGSRPLLTRSIQAPATVSARKRRCVFVSWIPCACLHLQTTSLPLLCLLLIGAFTFSSFTPYLMYQRCPSTVRNVLRRKCGVRRFGRSVCVIQCATWPSRVGNERR